MMKKSFVILGIRITAAHQHNQACYLAIAQDNKISHRERIATLFGFVPVYMEYVRK